MKPSQYESKEWGVAFQYPPNYAFKEWNTPAERNGGWQFGRVIDKHPGQVLIATVLIPTALFPGTDLTSAVFGLSANRHLTKEECWTTVAPDNGLPLHTATIDGVLFHWSEGGDAPMAAGYREYAGFSSGVCYELETVIATMRSGPPEGATHVDEEDLERRIDELVHSVKIHPAAAASNAPEIRSFTAEMAPQSTNIYRVKWQITGASVADTTLDLNCFVDLSLMEVTNVGNGGKAFRCGELETVTELHGSLDLKIENHTGFVLSPEIRLLVLGREPVSQTVKISLPSLALVRTINGVIAGRDYAASVYSGIKSGLFGAALYPQETVWIGSTSITASSSDTRSLEFTVPISIAGGRAPLYLEDARGRSNEVMVNVVRSQPRINFATSDRGVSRDLPLVPGESGRVVGIGFTSNTIVHIGETSVPAEGDTRYPQFAQRFIVPASLHPGSYLVYVSDELGKSNEVAVIVVDAK
ncbi:MAG: hypothetical protein WCA15_00300 [Candidatus Acidiferrales bacterium]